jgi:hypothetical protein
MKHAPGVDDDRLAGHGFGAAHGNHHIGAIVLVGGLLQQRAGSIALDLLGPEISCIARALSGAMTSVSGASATAMHRVR